ncbi:hypothetical protein FHS07_000122 [Microbacterium proteolyticum]|uniref:Uncharacterized protein n=1 Tax=Microbacterium proteolyticum TaxID=1572644 RepID=A0A7W5CF08_9MICO|nr:hypothetical protein [Microbacterium proteolyticum]MBB3156438.1 hypothetical protein [Microbacterium proteolyticum]
MNRSLSLESSFFGPMSPDWTVADLLAWIGADDARCHDERLVRILDAVCRALDPGTTPATGRVVGLVRAVAMRVAAQPGSGERLVGEVVGVPSAAALAPSDLTTV